VIYIQDVKNFFRLLDASEGGYPSADGGGDTSLGEGASSDDNGTMGQRDGAGLRSTEAANPLLRRARVPLQLTKTCIDEQHLHVAI
jgi:hypothetical protein